MGFSVGQRGLLGRNLGFLHGDYMLRGHQALAVLWVRNDFFSIVLMACSGKLALSCKHCVCCKLTF